MLNVLFRSNFSFFNNSQNIYLDSAATTLKPDILLKSTNKFYSYGGSVHRSQYDLGQSFAYEQARDKVVNYFNVKEREAVIWTSGTTHSINLVANGIADTIKEGDEIIVSIAEHHSNFIPWQQLALRKNAKLIILPVDKNYHIKATELKNKLSSKTKIVAINLVSNVTGVRQKVEKLIPIIRKNSKAKILLDIAQAVISEKVDVQALDADFYAFSAHKMYGPTGLGVLMGKLQSLKEISPLMFGGKMVKYVDQKYLELSDVPHCFEAGTPNIAGVIAFGEVLNWFNQWDLEELNNYLYSLSKQFYKHLKSYKNIEIFTGNITSTIISFKFKDVHHSDIASFLSEKNIAIRAGKFCTHPYFNYLNETGLIRVSLAHYNVQSDIEKFFISLDLALELFMDE